MLLLLAAMTTLSFAQSSSTPLQLGEWLQTWLLCGPFPNPLAKGVTEYRHDKTTLGYYIDYLKPLGGESAVTPRDGLSFTSIDGKQYRWKRYESNENYINLSKIFQKNQKVVAYAFWTIVSDREQDVVLALGSNDGIRAWLNGRMVWDNHLPRGTEPDDDWVRVRLRKGDNSILLKIDQGLGDWGFYARFLSIDEKRTEVMTSEQPVEVEHEEEKDIVRVVMGRTSRYLILKDRPAYSATLCDMDGVVQQTRRGILGDTLTFQVAKLASGPYRINCTAFLPTGDFRAKEIIFFHGESNFKINVYDRKGRRAPLLVEMLDQHFQTIPKAIRMDSTGFYSILRPDISPFYLRMLVKSPSLGYRWLLADNSGNGFKIPENAALQIDLPLEAARSLQDRVNDILSISGIEQNPVARSVRQRLQNNSSSKKSPEKIYRLFDELLTIKSTLSSDALLSIWYAPGIEKIAQDEAVPNYRSNAVHLSLARNEYEPFQLALNPTTDLADVSIDFTFLKNSKHAAFDPANISLSIVDYVNIEETSDFYGNTGLWPDPLPRMPAKLALKGGKNTPIWVTVYAPKNQQAGVYEGEIHISARGVAEKSIPLQIKVYDFSLPDKPAIETAYGVSVNKAYHGPLSDDQFQHVHDLYMQLCASHRISPYTPQAGAEIDIRFVGDPPRPVMDYSKFDAAMRRYLDEFKFTSFDMGGLPGELAGHKRYSREYNRLFIQTYAQIQEHLRQKGWLEKAYWYWVDEPPISKYADVKRGMELLKKACPDIRRLLTCNKEKAPIPYFYNAVNLWVPKIDRYDEERAHARQKLGETVWWYVCTGPKAPYPNNFIDHPAINHRIRFWMIDKYGLDGSLYWAITYWRQNPWEQAMSVSPSGGPWGNGDGRLLYPPRRFKPEQPIIEPPVSSIRFENLRDGIEDIEYLKLLRNIADSGDVQARKALATAQNDLVQSTTCFEQNPAALYLMRSYVARIVAAHEKRLSGQ